MLGLIPLPYRILAGVVFALVLLGGAYYKGYSGEHDKLVTYRAQITQEAADQAKQSAAIDAQHKQEMNDAKAKYDADVARVNAYYRMHNNVAGSMPQTTQSAGSTNGAPTSGVTQSCAIVASRLYELQQLLIEAGVDVVR